jgi:hypothetical protein
MPAYGARLLLAGSSGTGTSKLAAGLLERLTEQDYQFCVLDPEGDHAGLDGAVTLGDRHQAPSVGQVMAELEAPDRRVVVNLLAVRLEGHPAGGRGLLARSQATWPATASCRGSRRRAGRARPGGRSGPAAGARR